MQEQLKQLGLTDKEANIYLALLKLGQTSAGNIIKEVRMHREIVYTALKHLIEKDLANFVIKKKIRYYQAVNPERIVKIAEENYQSAKEILPELIKLQSKSAHKQFIQVWEGPNSAIEARKFMLSVLNKGDIIKILGASMNYFQNMGDFSDIWHKKRVKKGIWYYILSYKTSEKGIRDALFGKYDRLLMKFLPENLQNPISTAIFGKYVLIQIWGDDPVMVLIENDVVAKSYEDTFDVLWKQAEF